MAEPTRVDSVSRRTVLKGIAGAAGLVSIPAIIAACSSTSFDAARRPAAVRLPAAASTAQLGNLSVGSYNSDPAPKQGMADINTAFKTATGITVALNTVDHNTFQDQITNYLGATPDTVYTWFSGFRMKFFADKGFNTADRRRVGEGQGQLHRRLRQRGRRQRQARSTASPSTTTHGPIFYRKSVFADKGYTVPTTWDELIALCKKMQTDGLTPIAFGDKDGWPAQGTFDILNLRLNGYDFHVGLMAGKEKWTDPKVTAVFQKWAEFLPYHAKDYAGLTWQNAADTLVQKKSGMYLLGLFVSAQFDGDQGRRRTSRTSTSSRSRTWAPSTTPRRRSTPRSTPSRSAPSHPSSPPSWMPPRRTSSTGRRASTQLIMFKNQPGLIPTATDADTSGYSALQKKAVAIVSEAQKITQYFDRDTRSDFAGANGAQSLLQKFLANPTQDLAAYQKSIQDFWDQLPPLT